MFGVLCREWSVIPLFWEQRGHTGLWLGREKRAVRVVRDREREVERERERVREKEREMVGEKGEIVEEQFIFFFVFSYNNNSYLSRKVLHVGELHLNIYRKQ